MYSQGQSRNILIILHIADKRNQCTHKHQRTTWNTPTPPKIMLIESTRRSKPVLINLMGYLLIQRTEPFLRNCQLCSYSRISQHFMELEGSLPCSQEPSTDPYPQTIQSNPYHPISLRSILILFTHLRLGLPNGLNPALFKYRSVVEPAEVLVGLRSRYRFIVLKRFTCAPGVLFCSECLLCR
jgi:hypothetical protein